MTGPENPFPNAITGSLADGPAGVHSAPVASVTASIDVRYFGAKGDGITDDTVALQAALNACPQGGEVLLPAAGAYRTSASLTIPPFVTLRGLYGERDQLGSGFARIKPFNGFTGSAVIRLLDKEEGGYAVDNRGVVIKDLSFDGSALSSTVLSMIKATGYVHGVRLENVSGYTFTKDGIETASYTRADTTTNHPYSWYFTNVQIQTCQGNGFNIANATDCVFIGCRAINNIGHGFLINGSCNSTFTSCRAEWNDRGFYFTGNLPVGGGHGAITVIGCSTDRNTREGFYVDTTNGAITFVGPRATRDGRNAKAGGGGYAGFAAVNSTTVLAINSITTLPGVDDDGTGTASPQYGASFSGNSFVAIDGASLLHGFTAGLNDSGTNAIFRRGASVVDRSGTTSSPSAINLPATATYPGNLPANGSYIFPVSQDSTGTTQRANNTLTATPFYLPVAKTILRVGAEVTAAGDAGSTIRLGIYADSSGVPGALLWDSGTNGSPAALNGASATTQEVTLATPLTLGPGWYWYGAVTQGAATTLPTLRSISRANANYPIATGISQPTAGTTVVGRTTGATVSGALPNPAATTGTTGTVPRLYFKLQT